MTKHLGFLATLGLCLFALWPLFQQDGLASGFDTLYHTYRVGEMFRSWEGGLYVPRWAESFYFGYGYPLFHYYASSTYYLTSIIIGLTGIGAIAALRWIIVIALLGAGSGMYLYGKTQYGAAGGMISAVVYVFSPYIVYTEPYSRGDFPELLAFGLFPWVLWRFQALITHPKPRNVIFAGVLMGLIVITHNLMALVFAGIMAGWLLWLRLMQIVDWRTWGLLVLTFIAGMGLPAYFWIPVIAESGAVQLENLIDVAELDYRNFFVPLETLMGGSPPADAGAVNGLVSRYNLGIATWLLALLALPFANRESRYFALLAVILMFLMIPASQFIWEAVPLLAFLQFPWRFLGPAAFCLAIVAGANAKWVMQRHPLVWMGVVAVPIVLAFPVLYVPEWDIERIDTSVAAYHQQEVAGLMRGTTFSGEYIPADVFVVPGPTDRLLADFADGNPVDKIHYATVPDSAQVTLLEQRPQFHEWSINAAEPFQLEILTFDFPGWQASIDDEVVDTAPAEPHGFITLAIPAGESTLRLEMTDTLPRTLGYGVSIAAVLGMLGLAVATTRLAGQASVPVDDSNIKSARVGLATGFLTIFLLAALWQPAALWYESEPGEALPAETVTDYQLGEQFYLLGYDLSDDTLSPGDRIDLRLYWRTTQIPDKGYAAFVHISTGGPPLAQGDKQNPGGIPTQEWTTAGYFIDEYVIYLPDDMPPGDYLVTAGLWTCDGVEDCGTGRLLVTDGDGDMLGDSIPLTRIVVE